MSKEKLRAGYTIMQDNQIWYRCAVYHINFTVYVWTLVEMCPC